MKRTSITLVVLGLGGCAVGTTAENESSTEGETFEAFMAQTYREPWEGGHFIVDGDTAIADEKQLFEFWSALQQNTLIVDRIGSADNKWNNTQKLNLTYCVSNNFGSRKAQVVQAVEDATTHGWETMANVNFVYVPAQDANCTNSNNNVLFNIRQVSNQPYLARAFFPDGSRASREVLVDSSSFGNIGWPLAHILGHELGHTLGFRHEHTRPEAGACFEDNSWRPLTPYDSSSIMHYPQCNGSSDDLDWTAQDAQGAASLYGEPGEPEQPEQPEQGVEKTQTESGTLARNVTKTYAPFTVVPGSTFTAQMTGTGDPDLYVRWGAAPTLQQFNCRPYTAGANETCSLTVPASTTQAYVMVRGYSRTSTFNLTVTWRAPN
ncbi:MAG: M57 family metalloprotease [Kofleriaceae bacterium]